MVNSEFTPNTSEIETALAVLAPTRLVWHQEQAGVIPNSCPNTAAPSVCGGHSHDDNDVWDSCTYWQVNQSQVGDRDLFVQKYICEGLLLGTHYISSASPVYRAGQ